MLLTCWGQLLEECFRGSRTHDRAIAAVSDRIVSGASASYRI